MSEVLLVLQHDAAGCGVACLAMVLGFHGAYGEVNELWMEGPLWFGCRGVESQAADREIDDFMSVPRSRPR